MAGAFRIAREERQLIRSALPVLLQFYFEQYRINDILSFFNKKMGDDFEAFYKAVEVGVEKKESVGEFLAQYLARHEEVRKANIALPEINRASLVENLMKSTAELARVDPISAYRAKKLFSEFVLFQETELPPLKEVPQLYVSQWGVILAVYRKDIASLRALILRIAFKAGVVEYIKVRMSLGQEESEVSGGTEKAYRSVET